MNYMPSFITITIPEERRHSWRRKTYQLLKYNALQASMGVKKTTYFFGFAPTPLEGLQHSPQNPQLHFFFQPWFAQQPGWLPLPKINSCISPWHNLVSLVQFKKRKKTSWRSVPLVTLQALASNFLKFYKWYQIAQSISHHTKNFSKDWRVSERKVRSNKTSLSKQNYRDRAD